MLGEARRLAGARHPDGTCLAACPPGLRRPPLPAWPPVPTSGRDGLPLTEDLLREVALQRLGDRVEELVALLVLAVELARIRDERTVFALHDPNAVDAQLAVENHPGERLQVASRVLLFDRMDADFSDFDTVDRHVRLLVSPAARNCDEVSPGPGGSPGTMPSRTNRVPA